MLLILTLLWCQGSPSEFDRRDLDRAVRLWARFEMPVPDLTARPVLVETATASNGTQMYSLAFRVKRNGAQESFICGTREVAPDYWQGRAKDIGWDPTAIRNLTGPWLSEVRGFEED